MRAVKSYKNYAQYLTNTLIAVRRAALENEAFITADDIMRIAIDPDGFLYDIEGRFKRMRFSGERVSAARIMDLLGGGDCDNFTALLTATARLSGQKIGYGLKVKNGKAYHIYPIINDLKYDPWRPYERSENV